MTNYVHAAQNRECRLTVVRSTSNVVLRMISDCALWFARFLHAVQRHAPDAACAWKLVAATCKLSPLLRHATARAGNSCIAIRITIVDPNVHL